jgi:hypothetical protein
MFEADTVLSLLGVFRFKGDFWPHDWLYFLRTILHNGTRCCAKSVTRLFLAGFGACAVNSSFSLSSFEVVLLLKWREKVVFVLCEISCAELGC